MSLAQDASLTALAADARAFRRHPELAGAPPPFRLALRMMARGWRCGRLELVVPSGRKLSLVGADAGPSGRLVVRDYRFMRRVLASGDIGLADGFMAGEWESPDLPGLLTVLALNFERMPRVARGNRLARLANRILHAFKANSRSGARRNIHAHYDLGNAFYGRWLDPGMTYSSACYAFPGQPLPEAQENKYRLLAERMRLEPEHRVLEIGCGWGGFAEYAAGTIGARVTGITISREQYDFARRRIFEKGLAERADIRLIDYRDISGLFERVASIEMFEAVGEKYWPAYFEKIRDSLTPGGLAGLQIITIRDDMFARYRQRADFIQKYIFPGGMLPSEARLRAATQRAGLLWEGAAGFGSHYADTLAAWTRRFEAAWEEIRGEGFDERFRRLWGFYLGYCEAGFRTGRTDVMQIGLSRA
ncbi:class I SAM-dependent methyltransferase [Phenylobacterium sp.]|jgi:cyclopropane-fatty-acyl-phospholipid synthase|uniref:class I SAM-dependent methyltransferase n=1 Tax=Phenylobacterium sp. TaxID=1871053 RepID=UPI003783B5DA